MCFPCNLGHRLKSVATGESPSFAYLLQLLPVAIQMGSSASVQLGTLELPGLLSNDYLGRMI